MWRAEGWNWGGGAQALRSLAGAFQQSYLLCLSVTPKKFFEDIK